MNTPKPIKLISTQSACTLRMALMTRRNWVRKLYREQTEMQVKELAALAHLASELGIEGF